MDDVYNLFILFAENCFTSPDKMNGSLQVHMQFYAILIRIL